MPMGLQQKIAKLAKHLSERSEIDEGKSYPQQNIDTSLVDDEIETVIANAIINFFFWNKLLIDSK